MKLKIIIISVIIVCLYGTMLLAGERVFIKEFAVENIHENKSERAQRFFTNVFLDEGYTINTMESLSVSLDLEEIKQAIETDDEKIIKDLLAISDVDYIVYGFIRLKGGYVYITAKMLDKSDNNVELKNVKTLRIKNEINETYFDEACIVLARFLVSNDPDQVQEFQDKLFAAEKKYEIDLRNQALRSEVAADEEEFRRKVNDYKKKRKKDVAGNYAILRTGYNFFGARTKNDDFNEHFERGTQLFVELALPLHYITSPNENPLSGFDLLIRYTYFYYPYDRSQGPPESEVYQEYWEDKKIRFHGLDFGLRYRLGLYFLMTKFDLYVMASARGHFWPEKYEKEETEYPDEEEEEVDSSSLGGVIGGGVEIAFFPYLGFFVEYNYGTSDIGKDSLDIESHQTLIGFTFRL